jgi:hypothetical protein
VNDFSGGIFVLQKRNDVCFGYNAPALLSKRQDNLGFVWAKRPEIHSYIVVHLKGTLCTTKQSHLMPNSKIQMIPI